MRTRYHTALGYSSFLSNSFVFGETDGSDGRIGLAKPIIYRYLHDKGKDGILIEISIARGDGTYRELMKKYKKVKLLILDEWPLYPLKESEARDLLELIEARSKVASTIFCSQFDTPGWHENLYDPTLADTICDHIIYDSYTIKIEGESMRKRNVIME